MPETSSRSAPRLAVSLAILLILALHALPVLQREQWRRQWPFLKWAMYKSAKAPGPIALDTWRIIGITAAGGTQEVTSELVGLPPMTIARMYTGPMDDGDTAAARRLMALLNRQQPDSVVALRLEGTKYNLTANGIVPEEVPARTFPAGPSAGGQP
jgi:hypothetical protein